MYTSDMASGSFTVLGISGGVAALPLLLLIYLADTNGDRRISEAELTTFVAKGHRRLDWNGDGEAELFDTAMALMWLCVCVGACCVASVLFRSGSHGARVENGNRWAVRFENGEMHRYTAEQMRAKFGVDNVHAGMSVEHATRGRAVVVIGFVDATAGASDNRDHRRAALGAKFECSGRSLRDAGWPDCRLQPEESGSVRMDHDHNELRQSFATGTSV